MVQLVKYTCKRLLKLHQVTMRPSFINGLLFQVLMASLNNIKRYLLGIAGQFFPVEWTPTIKQKGQNGDVKAVGKVKEPSDG